MALQAVPGQSAHTRAIGGRHGSLRVLTSAASPHGRQSVAQGQRRDRPAVAGHARVLEVPLPMMAVAFPILPGKTPEWRVWMEELNGARHEEFAESRRRAGVHELTFLQPTPMGDLVIVTLQGDDPERAFGRMVSADDAFTAWFIERAKAVHGVDLSVPQTGSPSELVADSKGALALAR